MEAQETAIETGLEGMINPDVQGGSEPAGEVADGGSSTSSGTSGAEGAQKEKGSWLSQVPKDIRKAIPEGKYDDVWDFVRDLKSEREKADSDATDAFAEDWKNFLSESDQKSPVLDALNSALKEAKVPVATAKKAGEAILKASEKNLEEARKGLKAEQAKRAKEFVENNWGSTAEERKGNFELYKRCLGVLEKEQPDSLKFFNDNGLLNEPSVIRLVMGMYSQRQEVVPPGGSAGGVGGIPGDRYGIV